MRPALLLLLLVLPACHSTFISAKDYDQTCATDSDCVAVADGDMCGAVCGVCPNAAVNAKVANQYSLDANAIACVNLNLGPRPAIACSPCFQPMAVCVQGKCGITR
jgi:hypothetical protein